MELAHTLGEGGPEIELLMIAAALLFLGIVFFVQKTVKPAVPVILVVAAVALVAGAFAVGDDSDDAARGSAGSPGDATLEIAAPAEGATVPAGEPVNVEIDVQNAPEGGHFDVRIDDQIEAMGSDPSPQVTFRSGEHTLSVEYVNSQHQGFSPPIRDEVTVTSE